MMFKKGSFEIGATVYPVAIKVRVVSFFLLSDVILTINISDLAFNLQFI